ncbi:hypothetical protein [Cellulomonas wangsupingiae]|uniref:Uncharacterized protein n=1 Tax=Cellulomonas wangsupingiae TaxID=2968085 RepID=A0ABY5K5L4_9CELL|nr:hypothetical protein [Cellulomonas wangsupingiae]MCC2334015.1 hypothetical protein [Cellulomonas wangsupingiae]UUI65265.1 hypothetical protein NP075_00530 [Cellulomonas wangsupingiae]
MPISDDDVLVTVQSADSTDAAAGHLGWGVLWSDDAVLVPGPSDWLGAGPFDVLVAHRTDGERGDVLRISPLSATRMGSGDGSAVLVQLPARVGRAPSRSLSTRRLREDHATEPDVWTCLERQGAVAPGVRERSTTVLEEIAGWEEQQRSGLSDPGTHGGWIDLMCVLIPGKCDLAGPFDVDGRRPRDPGDPLRR